MGVIGTNRLMELSHSGIRNDGKNAPERNIIGKDMVFDSNDAWFSFLAQAPTISPRPVIRLALRTKKPLNSNQLPRILK